MTALLVILAVLAAVVAVAAAVRMLVTPAQALMWACRRSGFVSMTDEEICDLLDLVPPGSSSLPAAAAPQRVPEAPHVVRFRPVRAGAAPVSSIAAWRPVEQKTGVGVPPWELPGGGGVHRA